MQFCYTCPQYYFVCQYASVLCICQVVYDASVMTAQDLELRALIVRSNTTENLLNSQMSLVTELRTDMEELKRKNVGTILIHRHS